MMIMESQGNTEQLLAATDEICRRSRKPAGLLVRVVAADDERIVLVHLRESEQRSATNQWMRGLVHRDQQIVVEKDLVTQFAVVETVWAGGLFRGVDTDAGRTRQAAHSCIGSLTGASPSGGPCGTTSA
jgi:hypothetical protein